MRHFRDLEVGQEEWLRSTGQYNTGQDGPDRIREYSTGDYSIGSAVQGITVQGSRRMQFAPRGEPEQ